MTLVQVVFNVLDSAVKHVTFRFVVTGTRASASELDYCVSSSVVHSTSCLQWHPWIGPSHAAQADLDLRQF